MLIKPPLKVWRSLFLLDNSNTELIYFQDKAGKDNGIFDLKCAAQIPRFSELTLSTSDSRTVFFVHKLLFITEKKREEKEIAKSKRKEAKEVRQLDKLPVEQLNVKEMLFSNAPKKKRKPRAKKTQRKPSKKPKKREKSTVEGEIDQPDLGEDIKIEISLTTPKLPMNDASNRLMK